MAKKKEEEIVAFDSLSDKEQKKKLDKAFEVLQGMNGLCTMLDQAQSNVESFEDTGCYILNALLSGELRGGFPEGRMSLLAAESSVGKSFIGMQAAAYAQKRGKRIVVFDSEYAIDDSFATNLGLDTKSVVYFPVKSIEQCRNSIYKFLNFIIDNKMQGKFFILIDSLANMIAEIEMNRAEKESTSTDMGTRARAMKSLLQTCINLSGPSKTTIVCTNHIYDNPNAMFPSLIKPMPGGKCVTYLPSTILQLSATNVKEGDDRKIDEESTQGGKGLLGKAVTGLSVKNRICKPFIVADMFISFRNGMSKYYGLLELAQEFGLIVNRGGYYYLATDLETRIGSRKTLINNAEFWEGYMDTLQAKIKEEWHYSSHAEKEEAAIELAKQSEMSAKAAGAVEGVEGDGEDGWDDDSDDISLT